MGIRLAAASIFLAAGLVGCATDPNGMRYVDGSYYAPVGDGQGDYYVGRSYDNRRYLGDPYFDDFFWLYSGGPWYGGWYGSPYPRYGGYCSARYRYCDPFPHYGFPVYFGDPWYYADPWYYGRHDRRQPPSRRISRPPVHRVDDPTDNNPPDGPRYPERTPERREQRSPPRRDPMAEDNDDDAPRARRTAPRREDPPRPRREDKDEF